MKISWAASFLLVAASFTSCESTAERRYVRSANADLAQRNSRATGTIARRFTHIDPTVPGKTGMWIGKGKKVFLNGKFNPPEIFKIASATTPFLATPPSKDVAVLVGFLITKEGKVSKPEILRSTDHYFDESVLEAIVDWKFKPATYQGEAVVSAGTVPFVFHKDTPTAKVSF